MAEGGDGNFVADLAKQQSCRPKYTRVISWELSRQNMEDALEKKKKQRSYEKKLKKDKRIVEDKRVQEILQEIESSSSETSDDSSSLGSNAGLDEDAIITKKLAKTKIRKKAKKRRSRELFECAMSDFRTINLDMDSEFVERHKPTEEFIVVNKPVPSLVDLCLRVDWKIKGTNVEINISDIPPGLRNIVRIKQQMCRTNALHLKYLHLTLASREAETYENYLEPSCDDSDSSQKRSDERVLKRTAGSVFASTTDRSPWGKVDTVSVSSVLEGGYICADSILEDVVQTMDLMLPPVVRMNKRDTEATDSSAALRAALRKRYPKLMTYAFDESLPYVWWSRGNYGLAHAAFLRLTEKHKGKVRGLYLNEIGRLYLYQNEPDLAVPYFKEAQDVFQGMNTTQNAAVSLQSFILCANAYDQGVLDQHKALKSYGFWQGASKCYDAPLSVMRYAVETLLSIHLSSYFGDIDKLKSIRDTMDKNMTKYPALGLHLSCLNLILDDEMLANKSLRNTSLSSSIWQPVFEQKKKGILPTMPVVWRTQLLPPEIFFVDDPALVDRVDWKNHFCDLYGMPLQLRLTHEGYLTGSMRMLLPAMRSILLDPYTGIVAFPEVPLKPESLTSYRPNDNQFVGNTRLPYHYTILEKPDGSRIDYIESKHPNTTSMCNTLRYLTPDGKVFDVNALALVRASEYLQLRRVYMSFRKPKPKPKAKHWKKNMKKKQKQKTYEEVEEENMTYYEREFLKRSEAYQGSEQWKKDCLAYLRKLYNENKEMTEVHEHVMQQYHVKLKKELEKDPEAKMKYKKHFTLYGDSVAHSAIGDWYFSSVSADSGHFLSLSSFKVYGHTVVLMFGDAIVIVNCKDENTIQEPKIHLTERMMRDGMYIRSDHCWACEPFMHEDGEMLMIPASEDNYHPDAKVIGLYQYSYAGSSGNNLYVFDEDGNVLRKNTKLTHTGNVSAGRLELSCVISTRMYGIPLRGDRVFCDHIDFSTTSKRFNHRLTQLQSFREHLILGTAIGIAFMNKDMKLCKIDTKSIASKSKYVRVNVSEDGHYLTFEGDNTAEYKCTILNRMQALKSGFPLIIAHGSHVIVIGSMGDESVCIRQHAEVPGRAVEAHYISKTVGFVVTFTLDGDNGDNEEDFIKDYREHVLHFDTTGTIRSILPFFAHGLRDFFSVELPENSDVQGQGEHVGKPGWYLYLYDGHGGIRGIYMGESDCC